MKHRIFTLLPIKQRPSSRPFPQNHRLANCLVLAVALVLTAACSQPTTQVTHTPDAKELAVFGWPGYIPQNVLDAFTIEHGVQIDYTSFTSYDEAVSAIRSGEAYDIVVLSGRAVAELGADDLLAELNYEHIPNFRNVTANFRDLAYDRNNKYSVPIQWGTTGIIVRSDLVDKAPQRWADLWDPTYAGKIGLWPHQRMVIGIALKSLGYSVNTEDPLELEAASARLLALKPNVSLLDLSMPSAADVLVNGSIPIVYGWSNDIRTSREGTDAVDFIYSEEGTILWVDNLVIPANSANRETAELFINFLLVGQNSAQITNEIYVATPNDATHPFVKPELLADPVIFPTNEQLKGAEIPFPLTPEGQARYDEIWEHFLSEN